MTVLENLYYGNIHPNERMIKQGSEYARLSESITDYEQKLFGMLSEEGKTVYNEIVNAMHTQTDIAERESFTEGFRLGVAMTRELIGESETQLIPMHPIR